MDNKKIAHYLLIIAAAFIFLAFGIWELINPNYWAGFVPSFISFNPLLLVRIHGAVLCIVGLWFLSGKKTKIAAILGSLMMLQIIGGLILTGWSDILIRDIGILLLMISLYFDELSS